MEEKIKLGNIEIPKPRKIVYDILKYKKGGTVLDLGCAYGRNSLFLSYNGFKVTSIEKEKNKIEWLRENSKKLGLKIQTHISNIEDFVFDMEYDVIVATMVLHFLSAEKIVKTIPMMQKFTNRNGLNVITVYTDKNPIGIREYLFKENELKNYYSNWNILEYEEYLGEKMENPKDGGPERRYIAKLIAKKI